MQRLLSLLLCFFGAPQLMEATLEKTIDELWIDDGYVKKFLEHLFEHKTLLKNGYYSYNLFN